MGCGHAGRGEPPYPPGIPEEFSAACLHPGALVDVRAVPVTIAHASCDLTGVRLRYGLASAVVPASGRADDQVETFASTTAPTQIAIVVAPGTQDVTVTGR